MSKCRLHSGHLGRTGKTCFFVLFLVIYFLHSFSFCLSSLWQSLQMHQHAICFFVSLFFESRSWIYPCVMFFCLQILHVMVSGLWTHKVLLSSSLHIGQFCLLFR